ncbi:hypothetical protein EVAR_48219_1 [Eumeta japonica]|uniref:Uncharacterized protein n=1 Tax=Eumeta variegata TaxID=151549 RepID=A0A4C1YGJ4_EUMVA|nr:hypothetical protein EVAR_48219_1 [Eumeta japonica]
MADEPRAREAAGRGYSTSIFAVGRAGPRPRQVLPGISGKLMVFSGKISPRVEGGARRRRRARMDSSINRLGGAASGAHYSSSAPADPSATPRNAGLEEIGILLRDRTEENVIVKPARGAGAAGGGRRGADTCTRRAPPDKSRVCKRIKSQSVPYLRLNTSRSCRLRALGSRGGGERAGGAAGAEIPLTPN